MSGEDVTLDAGARAALEAKKPLTYVCPPAAWAAAPVLSALRDAYPDDPRLLILAPEVTDLLDVARTLRPLPSFEPIHAVTGIARASRWLTAGAVRTLAVTPRDAIKLAQSSKLKLGDTPALVLLWPEFMLAAGDGPLIDTLLAEAPDAQRIIITSDPDAVKDLITRHAHRASLVVASRLPAQPVSAARFVVVDSDRRAATIRATLDTLNPGTALIWEPSPDRYERWVEFAEDPSLAIGAAAPPDRTFDVAITTELPSAEVLSQLATVARDVIVLVRAAQLPYLQRIAKPLRGLRLAGVTDRAQERAHQLRQSIRERLESGDVSPELLALGPLFDEYDPALVAAALAHGPVAAPAPAVEPAAAEPAEPIQAWVRIRVGVGSRDRVRPADLVGALLNGVGLPKDHIGKVTIKEGFSIVEIRAETAPRTMRALVGLKVRGKSLSARIGN